VEAVREGPQLQDTSSLQQEVTNLVQLQNFDGSFSLDYSLGEIVGHSALWKPADVQTDDIIWATALAVAFLRKHLTHPSQLDVLDGILEKVWKFVEKKLTRAEFEELVERVVSLEEYIFREVHSKGPTIFLKKGN